jgi:type IV secretion system protein VirB11
MLRSALGPHIGWYLEDPDIVEVMLNPDGRLWIDRLSCGLEDIGRRVPAADGERIVRLLAHHVGTEAHAGSPRVSAELPETGERFEGLLPPIVMAPAFAIRKPAVAVFRLEDYVACDIMTAAQAATLRTAVTERRNVLVAGGTSTGKTTLVNALLHEVVATGDRVVLIEDTRELQCAAPNLVAMRTKDGVASLTDLVRSSSAARPYPDRRGARPRSTRSLKGLGHGASRRRRHDPCVDGDRRIAASRAARAGGGRDGPASADRGDDRPRRGPVRARHATQACGHLASGRAWP